MMKPRFELEVAYPGLPSHEFDELIFKIGELFKGEELGAGYFFGEGMRDCTMEFKSEEQAQLAVEALLGNTSGFRLTLYAWNGDDTQTIKDATLAFVRKT